MAVNGTVPVKASIVSVLGGSAENVKLAELGVRGWRGRFAGPTLQLWWRSWKHPKLNREAILEKSNPMNRSKDMRK